MKELLVLSSTSSVSFSNELVVEKKGTYEKP